jgi:hypothetical protein
MVENIHVRKKQNLNFLFIELFSDDLELSRGIHMNVRENKKQMSNIFL